jgi:hypothetical protein
LATEQQNRLRKSCPIDSWAFPWVFREPAPAPWHRFVAFCTFSQKQPETARIWLKTAVRVAVFQIFQLRARGSVFSLPDVHEGATTPAMVPFHRSWAVYDFDAFFRFCSVNTRNSQNLAENGRSGGCFPDFPTSGTGLHLFAPGNSQNLASFSDLCHRAPCYVVHVAGSPCHRMANPTWTPVSRPPPALADRV